jgi:hypothetical protein
MQQYLLSIESNVQDDDDGVDGDVLVIDAETKAEAREKAATDPRVQSGWVITNVTKNHTDDPDDLLPEGYEVQR